MIFTNKYQGEFHIGCQKSRNDNAEQQDPSRTEGYQRLYETSTAIPATTAINIKALDDQMGFSLSAAIKRRNNVILLQMIYH